MHFSRDLGGGSLYISRVLRNTFVQAELEGPEVAAATAIEMKPISMPPSMTAGRLLLFVIRERTSGTLHLLGKIVEPLWEE